MTEERCVVCDEPTGRAGRDDDSLYCGECDLGPLCQEHYDAHIVMVRALYPEPLGQKVEGTMIPLLEEQDWQSNEGIARRLNDVIVAVNALDARLRRVEAREGGQAADGENMCPKCGGSGMIYCGWGEAEYCECRRDWKKEYEDAEEAIGGLVDERDELRAERDEALARVAELEADAALGALVRRMQRRVIVERLRDGTYSVGLRGEPRVYFRDEERTFAWAADAALDKEATDAH